MNHGKGRNITRQAILGAGLGALCLGWLVSCRPADSTAPTIEFLAPRDGDTLYAGTIRLRVEAHDNIEVTNVTFAVDGEFLDSTGLSFTDTFAVLWDASAETLETSHRIGARAFDRAGNVADDSVLVRFGKEIPAGALTVTTVPPGAVVWLDGTNTGRITPATIESLVPGSHQVRLTLAHHGEVDTIVSIYGGQTTALSCTLWGYAVVRGTVTWPGHGITPACVALLDTSLDGHGAYILYGPVDTLTGGFQLAARLALPDSAYVLGFDDVDGNHYPSPGDGQGFWDRNGDQQMTVDDRVELAPGDTIAGALVVLRTIPGLR